MNKYQYNILCDDGDVVYVLAGSHNAAIQEARELGYRPVKVEDDMDSLAFDCMKEFGFDNIDGLSRFDLFKLGLNYGIRYQLMMELANIKGEA